MKFAKDIQAKELLMCLPSQTSRATSAQTMKIKRTVVLSHHLDLFKGHDDLVELIGTVLKSLAAAADETFPALVSALAMLQSTILSC